MKPRLLLPVLWCCVCSTVFADGSPQDWLERMSRAFREQNYQGILIYGDSRQWETMAVTHGMIDGVEHEKLRHLTGVPREVIRHGQDATCIHPGEHGVPLNSTLPAPLQKYGTSASVGDYYDFHLGGVSRVAGQYARELDIMPKDDQRYGYHLWLDQHSGLLLRSDMLDGNGQVLERFQFADVEIGNAIDPSAFEPDGGGHPLAQHPAETQDAFSRTDVTPHWLPAWVPGGFEMTAAGTLPARGEGVLPALRLMYTDGLAAFTVFIDAVPSDALPEMVSQWGATAAAVRYRKHEAQRYRITAVGELPPATMVRIASSVDYHETSSGKDE